MKEYVLVHALPSKKKFGEVLLILKDRPVWQRGKLNLPGGKVEKGETPKETAFREVIEETGLEINNLLVMGKMVFSDSIVHCLIGVVDDDKELKPREGETETPIWLPWKDLPDDVRLMRNLKIVIPLLMMGVRGWILEEVNGEIIIKEI